MAAERRGPEGQNFRIVQNPELRRVPPLSPQIPMAEAAGSDRLLGQRPAETPLTPAVTPDTTTTPVQRSKDSDQWTRRDVLKLGKNIAIVAALAGGASAATGATEKLGFFSRMFGRKDSQPQAVVPVTSGETPSPTIAPASPTPDAPVTLTPQVVAGNPNREPTSTIFEPTATLPRQEVPIGTPGTPAGGIVGTPSEIPGTPSTSTLEASETPEVKKEFSVSVNIIRPGDKKYEDVFGPIGAIPVKEVVLNPQYVHPSGLNAVDMQKRVNAYGQAAGRYADEWWVNATGKKPDGRPSDVSPENPKIKQYMQENKPYSVPIWADDTHFFSTQYGPQEGVIIDPSLGCDVNIIPISSAAIEKMRIASIPSGVDVTFRTGINNGKLTYNIFTTPAFIMGAPDRINKNICYIVNATQNPVLTRTTRDGKTPPNFLDTNLVDMYFSTVKTDSAVPNTAKEGRPTETPLYIIK